MKNAMRMKNSDQGGKRDIASLMKAARGGCLSAILGVTGALGACSPQQAVAQTGRATEIWLQPNSTYEAKTFGMLSHNSDWSKTGTDFWQFFSAENDSNPILKDIKVIKLSPAFVGSASKTQLQAVYRWLHSHNIQLAVGIEMLRPMARDCGRGIEGFSSNVNGYLNKLKHTGANVAYFVMDEPLYFGSQDKASRACQASFEAIARNIQNTAKEVKALFPNAQIGEIEPVPQTTNLASWFDVYRQVMGEDPAVFFADVSWKRASDQQLADWSRITRQHHIKFGIIYNAFGMKTDKKWAELVEDNIKRIESDDKIVIDIALFQSWAPQPSRLFPADRVGTMSNAIEHYLERN